MVNFNLTPREFDVLKLVVKGKNNSQIAEILYISIHTVKAHISSIIRKFEVKNRVGMVVVAITGRLI